MQPVNLVKSTKSTSDNKLYYFVKQRRLFSNSVWVQLRFLLNIVAAACALWLIPTITVAQRFDAPLITVKTNLLSAPVGNLNASTEFIIRRQMTWDDDMLSVNIAVSYNPFTFRNNRKLKHIAFQPEYRIRRPTGFGSAFVGINANYAVYNVGGIELPFKIAEQLNERRYEGQLYGAGLGAGAYFGLSRGFGLEASLGAGYIYLESEVYRCETCGTRIGMESRHYMGLNRAALSVVYTLK